MLAERAMTETRLTGYLATKQVGTGSKFAHKAVSLNVGSEEYVVKLQDENPFETPKQLNHLIGKRVSARGYLRGSTFVASSIEPEE